MFPRVDPASDPVRHGILEALTRLDVLHLHDNRRDVFEQHWRETDYELLSEKIVFEKDFPESFVLNRRHEDCIGHDLCKNSDPPIHSPVGIVPLLGWSG